MSPSITTTTTVTPPSPISGTSAEVAPTDTLMPEGGGHGNVFVSNKGALAGLILGCLAFAGLVAAMGLFAYRRHRARSAHNADAVSALRRGPGHLRAHMLDDDDDNRGHMGGMAFLGAHPVSRQSGGAPYAPLRSDNALEGAAGEGNVGRQDVSGSGVVALPPIPILRGLAEEMEDAVLMHPARRSNHYVAAAGVGNGSSPRSQALPFVGNSSSGTGTGSAVWLGGPVVSSPETSTTGYFDRAAAYSLPARSMSPSSVYSDDVMSAHPDSHSIVGVIGRYVGHEQMPYGGQDSYASSSMYRHGGAGSSSGGHGSLNDDKIGGSLSGDVPSTTTHSSHVLLSRPTPVSTPSSLLPTKTAPPTPYRNDGKRGFIGRSLRSLRFRSAPTGLSLATTAGAYSSAGPDSAPKQRALHGPLSSQHASTIHPQPPTLSPIPRPLLHSKHSMPERAAPYRTPECGPFSLGAPVWPSISVVPCRSGAPSPALTEGSSRTPDGLLNPRLVNSDGMQSRGALSFRDDMDYSRSIGGVSISISSCSVFRPVRELELTIADFF
uniref:N/A n=1 Tax=Ganoderma boninense TaxID=34458 RepID=A0A5K1JVN9_9APHY|nr:N/A [Ganoderma boninense]